MKKHGRCACLLLVFAFALWQCGSVSVLATLTQEEQEKSLARRKQEKAAKTEKEAQSESGASNGSEPKQAAEIKTGSVPEQETEAKTASGPEREPEAKSKVTSVTEAETESKPERETESETESESETERETQSRGQTQEDRILVAIDPCRQAPGADITGEEPIGPDAEEMVKRASEGGTGCVSGQEEYELNLQVALRLQKELKSRGYDVILTRDTNEVDLSYRDRCGIANEAGADIMVRLYANNSSDEEVYGAHIYCPTQDSPYLREFYDSCLSLADFVEKAYCAATGISDHGIWMTDRVAGMNWCEMPVVQLEMGNLQNQYNDAYMAKEENRDTMAVGIADGIDDYFGR